MLKWGLLGLLLLCVIYKTEQSGGLSFIRQRHRLVDHIQNVSVQSLTECLWHCKQEVNCTHIGKELFPCKLYAPKMQDGCISSEVPVMELYYIGDGVQKTTGDMGLREGDIRLVDGNYTTEGRVEIYHNGEWGTVCDDVWNIKNANVACRQLGFGSALEFYDLAHFGQGTGPIMMDNIQCSGDEQRLMECPFAGWKCHNCHHTEDAGVTCKP